MREQSRTVVMAGLLALFATPGLQAQPKYDPLMLQGASAPVRLAEPPLPGTSRISKIEAKKGPDGQWTLSVDYFYTGEPRDAHVRLYQMAAGANPVDGDTGGSFIGSARAQRGAQSIAMRIRHPSNKATVTTQFLVGMGTGTSGNAMPIKATQAVNIVWQDPVALEVEAAIQAGESQKIVDKAVDFIDKGHLEPARTLLQALVERQPGVETAYIELARVAMKSESRTTGLRDAESLLRSALKLKPDSVNAKILLGYVYAHQRRYKEAEPLFIEAAAKNPPNLWLWTNWGELYYLQKRYPEALAKYREAVARPPTGNTYDKARIHAYSSMTYLLARSKDLDGLEAVHKQRVRDYPAMDCFSVDYASFLVLERGNDAAALAQLRDVPSPSCDPRQAREVQGLAHYVRWSRAQGDAKTPLLLQARAFLPSGAWLIYLLASGERTLPVAQQLVAAGEKVDIEDSNKYTALGIALREGDIATARRLLRMGAKLMAEQGQERIPAALIPVTTADEEGIRLMQSSGVDYGKMRYGGRTVLEAVRGSGDKKLLQMLQGKSGGT